MIVKIYCVILSAIIAINAQSSDDISDAKTCYIKNGTVGECVPYYLCENGTIITDGSNLLDVRFEGGCQDYFEECCLNGSKIAAENVTTVKRNATYAFECGIRNPQGVLSVDLSDPQHGESQYGEFPWMVALLEKDKISKLFKESYKCGGSLIAKNVVLTAAHCLTNLTASNLIVRLGEWDSKQTYELFSHADHEVEKIVIHEKFYKGGLHNDVALLFLKTDVQMTETVDTICLPSQDQPIDMTRCFATGWGKNKFGKEEDEKAESLPTILKKIELPTVQHANCQDTMRRTRLGRRFKLDSSFMCAGGEKGIDTCKGDGGSPLVCPVAGVPNKYYQAGIVAWGIGCGEKGVPGVYVNVAKFSDWINEQMTIYDFGV